MYAETLELEGPGCRGKTDYEAKGTTELQEGS